MVAFIFSKPMNPNEIDELDQNEWNEFLDAVRAMGSFIVLLLTYRVRMKIQQKIMPLSDRVLFITDGSDTTTEKHRHLLDLYKQI